MIKKLFLSALLLPSIAVAQDVGPSYLGMCSKNFACDRSLSVFQGQKTAATGWLVGTFGDACPCAEKFLSLPNEKKIARIHVANCTCFPERGRRCARQEPFFGESIRSADSKLKAKNGRILRKFRRNLNLLKVQVANIDNRTELYISPCLESMFSHEARRVMLDETAKAFPGIPLVDNPVSGSCLQGVICEKHGPNPPVKPRCVVDTDGSDFLSIPPVRRRDCIAQFYWAPWMNLLNPKSTKFVEPLKRTDQPSRQDIRNLRQALDWP